MAAKNKKILFSIVLASLLSLTLPFVGYKIHETIELDNMVGQMILVGFRGTSPDDTEVKELAKEISRGKIGGVILFSVDVEKARQAGFKGPEIRKQTKSRNIIYVDQVYELNKFLSEAALKNGRPPLFISIDQEGGIIVRLDAGHGFDFAVPSAKEIARTKTAEQAEELYSMLGQRLRALGFNLNFAPTIDVDINPESPAIGALGRSFSDDPDTVVRYGRAAAQGLENSGILYSLKHFPGHGSAAMDTHDGMTDITRTWRPEELVPYGELAYTDMPGMVMVAHVMNTDIDPDHPSSLSAKTIGGILRNQIGFDGVVISDDLQMDAIHEHYGLRETLKLAIDAGNDIMLLGNNQSYTRNIGRKAHDEIVDMVHKGEIKRSRIKESFDRIIKLKGKAR